jgi:hypothetical protein
MGAAYDYGGHLQFVLVATPKKPSKIFSESVQRLSPTIFR